ncbi:MAG: hypothetical protein KIT33_13520 [Candidatus Kapabacteria bacterium]|nr:hypothetical protein [Ignavibacteriota bacterium]MCW5885984.1 hypothetical protein [Candidatus Kapabacteria bacterium]
MENELLVHDFLDGTLAGADEEKLFSLLASEGELRNELKHQLAVKMAVRADVKAFVPKADSTLQIFDKLGLALPLAALPAGTAASVSSAGIGSFIKTNYAYMLTGLLSAAAAVVVMLLLFDFGPKNVNYLADSYYYKISPNDNHIIPVMESNAVSDDKQVQEKVVYKYVYLNKSENISPQSNSQDELLADNKNNNNAELYSSSILSEIEFDNINLVISDAFSRVNQNQISLNLPYQHFNIYDDDDAINNFAFEFRGSEYFNNNIPGIITMDNLGLLNTGATFLYKYDDELSFGIDYRRETFAQEFTGKEQNNYFVYRQEPNFQTISFVGKFSPEFIRFSNFKPFINTGFGLNSAGTVGRLMLGTDIDFSNNLYFTFGADYNILFFTQNGAYFISPKFGVHFGAGIKF